MSAITVYVTGNGTAWVDIPDPFEGETVTLYCEPNEGAELLDITAREEHGYSVALYVQEEQQILWQYETLDIYVEFSEPKIKITIEGDGTAYVSNENPVDGESVTLYCQPDRGRKIKQIVGWDENGNPVLFTPRKQQSFIWDYMSLEIVVTFGRKIIGNMPIWMYPCLRE